MKVLVTGGASSGKSAYAEQVAINLSQPHVYLATMSSEGEEACKRIERHRALRAGKGFSTVEQPLCVAQAALPPGSRQGTVLVEDLGNLVANALFGSESTEGVPCTSSDDVLQAVPTHPGSVAEHLADDVFELAQRCSNIVVVANEVGCDGESYESATAEYITQLGACACILAHAFDVVVEVVAGQPNVVKGVLE